MTVHRTNVALREHIKRWFPSVLAALRATAVPVLT
jgi:hypothetical protein